MGSTSRVESFSFLKALFRFVCLKWAICLFIGNLLVAPLLWPLSAMAEESLSPTNSSNNPGALFIDKCSGCHTIGGGDLAGPDLSPMSQRSAADVTVLVKEMEKYSGALGDDEVQSLVRFLGDPKANDKIRLQKEQSEKEISSQLETPSAEAGQALFRGQQSFTNGGLACASCHRFGSIGGTMGSALTNTYKKMDFTSLVKAMQKANFRMMRAAYRDNPLTKQ